MAASSVARKLKRAGKPAAAFAVTGTAAAVATSLALTSAPVATAAPLNIDQQVLTAGPLVNLLPALGITSVGPISLGTIPLVAPDGAFLTLQLSPIAYDTQSIYNTINALPFKRRTGLLGANRPFFDRTYSTTGSTAGQFPAILSSGIGTDNAVDAYRAQRAAVLNNGLAANGLTPFQPSPVNGIPNQTNQELLLLRNSVRPNGGIQQRFAPILNLFGVDTSMPASGFTNSPDGKIVLNTGLVDLSWAYDPMSDFPVTLNPFAIANSLLAALPTNLLGGLNQDYGTNPKGIVLTTADGTPTDLTGLGLSVADTLGILNRLGGSILDLGVGAGATFYGTIVPNDLPLLEPLRLPSRIINLLTGLDLPTPIADALQPALTILVNTGYSDVITPADLPNDPSKWYTRSYTTANVVQPFLSVSPLTFEEWTRVPGDVFNALVKGFSDVFIPKAEPAQSTPPAAATPPVSVTSAAATAKLVTATVDSAAPQAITPLAPREAEVTEEAPAAPAKPVTRSARKAAPAAKPAAATPATAAAGDPDSAPAPKRSAARSARSAR